MGSPALASASTPAGPEPTAPRPRTSGREAALLIGGGLALLAAAFAALALMDGSRGTRITEAGADSAPARYEYVGAKVCSECHPGATASFARSGHGQTLRSAEDVAAARGLDGRTVADPEIPGVTWTFAVEGGRLHLDRAEGGAVERLLVDYAFGSGHHATTFLTVVDPDAPRALEHRLTLRAADDTLYITPGQDEAHRMEGTTPRGRELSPKVTAKCFGCHTTPMVREASTSIHAENLMPNVSCERCHGPGRSHVEAARAGRTGLAMPFGIDRWTPASQMTLCGECHRHPARSDPKLIRREDPAVARFQPVGLMSSACYVQSGGAVHCLSCHNPHARSSTDTASYEAVCLKCHEPAPTQQEQTACPVSPRTGCIDCHMPRVDSGQQILFTDHWIRVRGPSDPPAGTPPGP